MAKNERHTLYDKIWNEHLVVSEDDGTSILYIDRHLVHEVTSAQAFEGLRDAKRKVWRERSIVATTDHNTPTVGWDRAALAISDPISKAQVAALNENMANIMPAAFFPFMTSRQGIIHIVAPENGAILPGMTVVCGDSHTSTHGAFGALAQGIGTSEVEHVLATQTLLSRKACNMLVYVDGKLAPRVSAKDLMLAIIGEIGTAGGTGCVIEFDGPGIRALSMEGRMTICNMAIEAGARSGLIGVDEKTIDYIKGRPLAPGGDSWEAAVVHWRTLRTDPEAIFEKVVAIDATTIAPQVTWGTSPEMVAAVTGAIPDPILERDLTKKNSMERALSYMGLRSKDRIMDIAINKVFIGSCTNSRIEDLREAASVIKKLGRKVSTDVTQALVVPGSGIVRMQAENEGLDEIFKSAGFEWRQPGCSMCLAMNEDRLEKGDRCASTSNRNFEGRQGEGSRTHLVSPAMAAAAAIEGRFIDVRDLQI